MLPTDDMPELPQENELDVLKARADVLGIQYHSSIGVSTLKAKINAKLKGTEKPAEDDAADAAIDPAIETVSQKRKRIKTEALALVRIKIACLNPAKKEYEGELFTVGNSIIPSLTKYVPFNAGDSGWHVPRIPLNQLQERQCQIFQTVKDERGNKVRKGKLIKEFAIEILPPLTPAEIKDLAQRQAMTNAID